MGDRAVEAVEAFDHGRGGQAIAADFLEEFHVRFGPQPVGFADAVAEEAQSALAQILGSSIRTVPAATLRLLANSLSPFSACCWFRRTRSALVI